MSDDVSSLRWLQELSLKNVAISPHENTRWVFLWISPLVLSTQSSRTRVEYLYSTNLSIDRIRSALRRSEPSSRSSLCGEQPHPWYHLQHQEEKSRHRGAEARVR